MTYKGTVERRRAAGLCRCGQKPSDGKKTCDDCIAKVVAKTRDRMRRRKAEGLCRCGRPARSGAKKCEMCLAEHVRCVAAVHKRRRGAGNCVCGQPPTEGKDSCERCLTRRKSLTQKHKANGVCVSCRCRPAESGHATCDGCFEKSRARGYEIRARYRKAVMDHYGGKCACCGETEDEFLTIDHKDNDGAEHRKSVDGARLYRWLMKQGYPTNFQILCMNCNWAKGRYGCCPHQRLKIEALVS